MWTSDSFSPMMMPSASAHEVLSGLSHLVFFVGGASSEASVGEESAYFTILAILVMSFMTPLNVIRQEISSPSWGKFPE